MLLIDSCLWAGEADMLDLRVRTLSPVVDCFVVVICPVTHQGDDAPVDRWIDLLRSDRFAYAGDRLVPYVLPRAEVPPVTSRGGVGSPDYMRIERWHRDGIGAAVAATVEPDRADLVMVSDVDEIPDPHICDRLLLADRMRVRTPWLVCAQRFHSSALDVLHPQQPWLGTTISRVRTLAPQAMRDARADLWESRQVIERAGWHFSWFGTDEERATKLASFSHAELVGRFDTAQRDTHANGEVLHRLTIGEFEQLDWPRPLRDTSFDVPKCWWTPDPTRPVPARPASC